MHVTLDVSWNRIFTPAPLSQGPGKELEPAARGREAPFDFAIDFHTNKSTALFVSVRTRNRHDIWRRRFRGASEHTTQMIFANVFELCTRHDLFVDRADFPTDLE